MSGFHVQVVGIQATLVQVWEIQEYHLDKQYVKCNVSSQFGFASLSSILFPVTFAKGNDGAKVQLPYPIFAKATKRQAQMLWNSKSALQELLQTPCLAILAASWAKAF